ncbi:hypothetical protein [Thermomonospora cellulosilytica]|uniref:Uncharacterized protein n=1 Tax=Thermomonospora cellulosilytica TaxID=1411118 RepID=A0A7W3MXG7_9ACTN|nr:hypothetical protein [Thermomonospora cellulosilytica]MBA9003685.1 hypothetical protein [Thermomonospora cellulosilytica]
MSDGTYRGRWIDEVFRTRSVSAEVQVFLLWLAHYYMSPAGVVSERREDLAAAFGCHPRKVSEKFRAAIDAGLLERAVRGQKGRNAEYRGIVQGADTRHPDSPVQGADTRHPESVQGAGFYHPEDPGQGADTRHPESVQGADTRPPEGVQGADTRHPAIGDLPPQPENNINHRQNIGSADGGRIVPLFGETTTPGTHTPPARAGDEDPAFTAFWKTYPRRVGKGAARKAWAKAIKAGADPDQIILGARRYATDPRRSAADIRYTAHPATWLNAERWTDEPAPTPPAPPRPTNQHFEQAAADSLAEVFQ